MASCKNLLAEEQVHCSICLDVFCSPVSIPCGHNFCRSCICSHWRSSALFTCPMCQKIFSKRPDISINTLLREIAEQFREMRTRPGLDHQEPPHGAQKLPPHKEPPHGAQKLPQGEQQSPGGAQKLPHKEPPHGAQKLPHNESPDGDQKLPHKEPFHGAQKLPHGEPPDGAQEPPPPEEPPAGVPPPSSVRCDVCTCPRRWAVRSCLVCLTSYCEEHLRSHAARFTKHKLVEPLQDLEERMCRKHERLLELFCKKDQVMVCVLCTEQEHRGHYSIPVEREWGEQKVLLSRTEAELQQMILERQEKVQELTHNVELCKLSSEREVQESMEIFSGLMRVVEKIQAELVLSVEEKQRERERWAQEIIQELQIEISTLRTRSMELEHLAHTEDHIYFLQSFPSVTSHPQVRDWSETHLHTEVGVGGIRRAVSRLEEIIAQEMEKLAAGELKKIIKYSVDVTLDPNTANPWLQLSEDLRQVCHLGAWQHLEDTPLRFDTVVIALAQQGFTYGRHYWEVQVGGKDDWYLGVARDSVNRKGRISVSTAHGYWALAMKKGQNYRASTAPPLALPGVPVLKRVGVYLDVEAGQVSFYDAQERSHIYTFMDTFREKLRPFFYLYCCDRASDVLRVCPLLEHGDNALT